MEKHIILLVEGICEISAFEVAFKKVGNTQILMELMEGDPLTDHARMHEPPKKIIGSMLSRIKREKGLRDSDISFVALLTDTDGAFVGEEDVIVDGHVADADQKEYEDDAIRVTTASKRSAIIRRNELKKDRLNSLVRDNLIAGCDFSVYYFSCNLDHVLHGIAEFARYEKEDFATGFAQKHDTVAKLWDFFSDESVAVRGTYEQTWEYIGKDENSLERGSNFHLLLERIIKGHP